MVLVPLVGVCIAVPGLLFVLGRILHLIPRSTAGVLSQASSALALGLTVLWLLPTRARARRPRSSLGAFSILLVLGAAAATCQNGAKVSPALVGAIFIHALAAASLTSGIAFARRRSQGRGGRDFTAKLLMWVILANVTLMLIYAGVVSGTRAVPGGQIWARLFPALLFAVILGVAVYLISLPFIVLAFRSPFYRERLGGWLQPEHNEPDEPKA